MVYSEFDEKIVNREAERLRTSILAGLKLKESHEEKEILVFLHYPPRYKGYICEEMLEILHRYEVKRCFYGHLHGASHGLAMAGMWDGIEYRLISADRLDFLPLCVNM